MTSLDIISITTDILIHTNNKNDDDDRYLLITVYVTNSVIEES